MFHFIAVIFAVTSSIKEQSVRVEQGVESFNSIERTLLLVDRALNARSVPQFKQGVRISFHNRAYLRACLSLEKLVNLTDVTIGVRGEFNGQVT